MKTALECAAQSLLAVTSFVIVSASFSITAKLQLALGIATALGFAASSAVWSTLNSRNYRQMYTAEKRRESWELKNYPKGEIEEMVELYRSRGLQKDDAEFVIQTMAKYEKFFVDVMMVEELGLLPPHETSLSVLVPTAFFSSLLGGVWPLVGHLVSTQGKDGTTVISCIFLGLIGMLLISCAQARFNHGKKWYSACFEMLLAFSTVVMLSKTAGFVLVSYLV